MGWLIGHLVGDYLIQNDWMAQNKKQRTWPCLVHVTLYTLSVCLFARWYEPWQIAAVFLPHFAIDRSAFVVQYMKAIGQGKFMQPPLGPWSIIVVDNVWHLVCLYVVSLYS